MEIGDFRLQQGLGQSSAMQSLIEAINSLDRPILAVDIPSGLDCDTGVPLGAAIRAAWGRIRCSHSSPVSMSLAGKSRLNLGSVR